MKILLPIRCPRCDSKLYLVFYEAVLNILRKRSWHVCGTCSYSKDIDSFKKELYCE